MTRPTRVLVPYITTYFGGVRRILGVGLPQLNDLPGLEITYAELCRNDADMDEMERAGVAVERTLGVQGRAALSTRRGLGRSLELGAQIPRLGRIAWRLADRLRDYDVCYVHGHRELLLAVAARALARSPDPAIVWHWHGPPLSVSAGARGGASARWFTRVTSPSCARVIAISEFCAGQARAMGVAPERVVTVLNAASVADDAADGGRPQALPARSAGQTTLLLPCASVRRHKGVHVAIEALRHLPRGHVLWVTGDASDAMVRDYLDELRALAERLRVSDRVSYIGARRDVHRVMASADVVLVPSVWEEPFGLIAAEAQLLGVPVIASNRGALPELMGDGRFGLVFDASDPRDLAAAIERMARDADLRARLSHAARSHASRRYSYQRWRSEVAAVLHEVAGRRSAGDAPEPALDAPEPR